MSSAFSQILDLLAAHIQVRHLKHLGLYVFRRDALLEYPTLPQGELERIEQLEQLRWLENGWKIRVAEVEHDAVSVDVPDDIPRVEKETVLAVANSLERDHRASNEVTRFAAAVSRGSANGRP